MIVTRNQAAKKLGLSSKTLNRFVLFNGIKAVSSMQQNGFTRPLFEFEEIERHVKEKYVPKFITREVKKEPESLTSNQHLKKALEFHIIVNKLHTRNIKCQK